MTVARPERGRCTQPRSSVKLGSNTGSVNFTRVPVVVAGDFNQARSGRRWSYGTDAARQRPTAGLASVDFADVLVPEGRFGCDELLHQVDAFLVVEHRHVDATGA
jgi:hypothetical protein